MAKKVQLSKIINGTIQQIYPRTVYDVVVNEDGKTLQQDIETINSDLEKLEESIPTKLSDLQDGAEIVTESEIASKFESYYTKENVYNRDEVDDLLDSITPKDVDLTNYYTKEEVDQLVPKDYVISSDLEELTEHIYNNSDRIDSLEQIDHSQFVTDEDVETTISGKGFATEEFVGNTLQDYVTNSKWEGELPTIVVSTINNKYDELNNKIEDKVSTTTYNNSQAILEEEITAVRDTVPTKITDITNNTPFPLGEQTTLAVPVEIKNIHSITPQATYSINSNTTLKGGYSGLYYITTENQIVSQPFGWFGVTAILRYPIKVHPKVLSAENKIEDGNVWIDVFLDIIPNSQILEPFILNIYDSSGNKITSHNLANCSLRGVRMGQFSVQ